MRNKIEETRFEDIGLFYFSSFIFKKNHGFIEEDNPSEKIVLVEEELNRVDMNDIYLDWCSSMRNVGISK